MEIMVEYLAKGFMTMLMISLPCVLVAASIGLVVGILQAVTQVQEQTIAAAPKIIAVFLTIIILGMWYIKLLTEFVIEAVQLHLMYCPIMKNTYWNLTITNTQDLLQMRCMIKLMDLRKI